MESELLVALLAALLGSAGIAGGIVAWRKAPAEKQSIIVTAAQGAVVIQSGVIDELREELDRSRERADRLEQLVARLSDDLHRETARLRAERDAAREENKELKDRVRQLEARVDELASGAEPGQAVAGDSSS